MVLQIIPRCSEDNVQMIHCPRRIKTKDNRRFYDSFCYYCPKCEVVYNLSGKGTRKETALKSMQEFDPKYVLEDIVDC